MSERGAVYRLYDAEGTLLYIGRTRRLPLKRWDEHEKIAPWWEQVARCELELMDLDQMPAEERRAILAENPPHNRQRYPLKPRPVQRTWEPLTDDLFDRLAAAGRKYRRTETRPNQEALAAVIYEAFLHGSSPMDISRACNQGREKVRRLAAAHGKLHPDLPPLPRRHGQGARRRLAEHQGEKAAGTPPKECTAAAGAA